MTKTEILAPAGSYETMQAAFCAGADAVYLAGQSFGARAYANNLDKESLIRAIDEAHMRGKKLYLTVNTLLKEQELKTQLLKYLTPLYEAGLDAVIVQDMGVLKVIHEYFEGLDIHASTQMTVTDGNFAKWLKQYGVTRIVPARELSLEEIRHMKAACGMEIETFVHGALCYCYSGQCLLSSMIGGRSGNRGRCAQPCRLPYELVSEQGHLNKKGENYLLSPKDIASLKLIPDLVDAGIDSLKIEGRMKKPEYAALVSSLYRKYVDLYNARGRKGYVVDERDINDLMDLYNRGGFTDGYYQQHNGRHMMSLTRPNHVGTKAGKVLSVKNQEMRIKAFEELHPQDVLEVMTEGSLKDKHQEFTLGEGAKKDAVLTVRARTTGVKSGDILYRTRNQMLIRSVSDQYVHTQNKEKIYGTLTISKDFPVKMTIEHRGITAQAIGEVVTQAANRPLKEEDVRSRMLKTGNTPYEFESLKIIMEQDAYVSIKGLNQIRRDAIEALDLARIKHYKRNLNEHGNPFNDTIKDRQSERKIAVSLSSVSQLDIVQNHPNVSLIYMELADFKVCAAREDFVKGIHETGKQLYVAMPHIFREDIRKKASADVKKALDMGVDGFLVRNIETMLAIRSLDDTVAIVTDASVYSYNSEARALLYDQGIQRVTVPLELNEREIRQRGSTGDEMIVYGYMPLMVSAQCPMKTTAHCLKERGLQQHGNGTVWLKDRKGELFKTAAFCQYCYSVIYNSKPLQLSAELSNISNLGISYARISLTTEHASQIKSLIDTISEAFIKGTDAVNELEAFTKGHFRRGVE